MPDFRTLTSAARTLTCTLLGAAAIGAGTTAARALDLVVAMAAGPEGTVVDVPVAASPAGGIAAAAMTVGFDTASLDAACTSAFFAPFAEQLGASGGQLVVPTSGEIGGVVYDQPFLVNPLPGTGLAVAGARLAPAPPGTGDADLFTLHFSLKPGSPPGLYPVTITPTTVSHTGGGYDPGGEPIDLVLGRDAGAGTFPVLLSAAEAPARTRDGWTRFSADFPDTDGDGLPDGHETATFGDLDTADDSTDTDTDGLSDLLEWLLRTDPLVSGPDVFMAGEPDESGALHLFFPMRTDHAVTATVAWTADLATWSTDHLTLTPRPDLGSGPGWTVLEATITPPPPAPARVLARVSVAP
jgi:hypothetical protein